MHRAVDFLQERFPEDVLEVVEFRGDTTLVVNPKAIRALLTALRDAPEMGYKYLSMIAAVDYYPAEPRFGVVYNLYSHRYRDRLTLKCLLPGEAPVIDSVVSVHATADFHEREAYDLMGIVFKGHPNLKRILLPEDFVGFPLRKEFPQRGQ
ncbi:MAG: NADH-quinone oxidoreductase subunit C [Syntrophobacterales bacterium]|nr:NADH-quinone oxidoreductase subunit C [Syntrophobacterales bacterium]